MVRKLERPDDEKAGFQPAFLTCDCDVSSEQEVGGADQRGLHVEQRNRLAVGLDDHIVHLAIAVAVASCDAEFTEAQAVAAQVDPVDAVPEVGDLVRTPLACEAEGVGIGAAA